LRAAFKGARTALIERSRGVSLHPKLDPVFGGKQELRRGPVRPATIAGPLRAATTSHCIAGEISVVSTGPAITVGTKIRSDARGAPSVLDLAGPGCICQ